MSSSAHTPSSPLARPLRGAALLVCALFCFSCMDTATKYLVAHYDPPLVVAMRYAVHFLLTLAVLGPIHGRALVRTQRTGLVLLRGAALSLASLSVALVLQRMPVAEMTAAIFTAPMLVVLLARPLLGERIGAVAWIAAIAGFAGVLLIVRPGGGALDALGIAALALGIAGNVIYQLLSRVLVRTESAAAMVFYLALVGTLALGVAVPWFWFDAAPSLPVLLVFLGMGAAGGLGHYLFTLAYREAPASTLSPLNYLQLVWAGVLGFVVFGHIPDALSFLGMAVIAASGVMLALHARRAARAAT